MRFYVVSFFVLFFILTTTSSIFAQTSGEINIQDSSANDLLCGTGVYNCGNQSLGLNFWDVFIIQNLHPYDQLNLTGSPKVSISGTGSSAFSVITDASTPVAASGTTMFVLQFCPTAAQTYTATVTIPNSDSDEGQYTFTIIGSGIDPEIHVKQNTADILCSTGSFSFGYIESGDSSSAVTFTIQNLGTTNLILSGTPNYISISGNDPTMFSINESSTNSPISSSGSTSFTVTFNPTNTGYRSAIISISNNDMDENPYTFTVFGWGDKPVFDFNNDGYNDVIIGAYDAGSNGQGCVYIFYGGPNLSNTSDANADVIITGEANGDEFGYSVSTAGDVDNDGIDDIIVGARSNGNCAGAAYIFFGSATFPSTINASSANVKLVGRNSGDYFGHSVSYAGNIDLDDYDDIIIGAFNAGSWNEGSAYIYCGKSRNDWNADPYLETSEATATITGNVALGYLGWSVSAAGNVNNDDYDDIIVGAYDAGKAYIICCGPNFTGDISVGGSGFTTVTINAENSTDWLGRSVSTVGDVNNDGYDDVIVGAPKYSTGLINYCGRAYILYGDDFSTTTVNAADADVIITGTGEYDYLGISVANAGNVNGDDYDDVIIGANDDGNTTGKAYIIYGDNALTDISASNADVILTSSSNGNYFGSSVCTVSDFDGDGYDDVIVGAYGTNSAYIYYGSSSMSSSISTGNADVSIGGTSNTKFGKSVGGGK